MESMQAFNDMNTFETIFFVLIVYSPYYFPILFLGTVLLIAALYLLKKYVMARRIAYVAGIGLVILVMLGVVLGFVI
jgi:hypothetical protein